MHALAVAETQHLRELREQLEVRQEQLEARGEHIADLRRILAVLLMPQVVTELSPGFQIIVSDHADLPHPWYQASFRYNWHDGGKLIPTTWLDTTPTP
ncbi:DUF3732 domain-containing protein [Streptomyces sp. NBC_01166]|uniref:DUF3732 domain-containing protein n=1 Tax=Streptomyces sp. NBC_01166 TaxID=2903755 RepID=UPI00386E857F|nr:DUF3732 domain-containing protein [Streptomyces sp. NBC_01166]